MERKLKLKTIPQLVCGTLEICNHWKVKNKKCFRKTLPPRLPPMLIILQVQYLYRSISLNTRYRSYLIPLPKYFARNRSTGLHLFSHRLGGLLLGGRLVGKKPFFCPKNKIRLRSWESKRYLVLSSSDP